MADIDDLEEGTPEVGEEWEEESTKMVNADVMLGSTSHEEKAYLIVISGSRVGAMVKVKDGMVIGRGRDVDFRAPDDGVSRRHVRIVAAPGGGLMIQDLGSSNGTYVNADRITEKVLEDGDKIRIGSTTILKFSYADQLEESFQQQMYNAALRDPLTQVYNRRHFDEQLAAEFSYCARHQFPMALIIMDLDHFKRVNDTYGHPVGDAVLIGMARLLEHSTRREDLFARFGGEEFVLLCRGITGAVAYAIADRIRRTLSMTSVVPSVPDLKVTMSAGLAALPDASIGTPQELIAAADAVLYRAKEMGRNRLFLYDPDVGSSQPVEPQASRTDTSTGPLPLLDPED